MLWNTDTQYYSRYEDLNFLYESVVRYAAEAYAAGEIGYALHTGDLVDQTDSAETARKQYAFASAMQKILDDAGVPNGVVAGNHDIRHTSADYSYYREYFNEARYADMPCYGGGLDDNASHFDLVSIGGYDFVILYLGCYLEDDPATLAWANEVLRTYSGRNAVIATHEYLNKHAQWSGDRAEVIWNELVVPNDNVKLILCGHNEGAADRLRQVGDSGRYVLELLADYQFAELGEGPQHVENGMTCDGEGFVRLLCFTRGGQLLVSTYSPAYDKWNYYPEYVDSLVYDLDLIETPAVHPNDRFRRRAGYIPAGVVGQPDIRHAFRRLYLRRQGLLHAAAAQGQRRAALRRPRGRQRLYRAEFALRRSVAGGRPALPALRR